MSEFAIPRRPLQAEVASRLRQEIVDGRWRPGQRLPERLLCERYGVSRSPLREAYQSLAGEGLLEIVPNCGVVVTAPTAERTLDHFELLRALELLGLRLACRDASDDTLRAIAALDAEMDAAIARDDVTLFLGRNNDVHRAIVLASGNAPLADAHLIASRQIIRVQNLQASSAHSADEALQEHGAIVAALLARDGARAVRLLTEHFATVEDNLRRRLTDLAEKA